MGCCNQNNYGNEIFRTMQGPPGSLISKFSRLYDIRIKYNLEKLLGKGSYGKVSLCSSQISENLRFAVKTLKKTNLSENNFKNIKYEIKNLSLLDHPNIAKFYESFEETNFIHLVMEYIPGDNLKSMVMQEEVLEKNICEMGFYLLKAIYYLKENGIVHRDIKPENILFSVKGDFSTLKLIDFGLSVRAYTNKKLAWAGTPFYMSPEVIEGNVCFESDIWSVGVILFNIVTGGNPFSGKNRKFVFEKITSGEYNSSLLDQIECSPGLKDLIKKMLVKNKENRITVEEALNHSFFRRMRRKKSIKNEDFAKRLIETLIEFKDKTPFQKEIYILIGRFAKEIEILQIKKVFYVIDSNNTGSIEFEEFKDYILEFKPEFSNEKLEEIFNKIDIRKAGKISYSVFIGATISLFDFSLSDRLSFAFQFFDISNTGLITFETILTELGKNKQNVSALKEYLCGLNRPVGFINLTGFTNLFYNCVRM